MTDMFHEREPIIVEAIVNDKNSDTDEIMIDFRIRLGRCDEVNLFKRKIRSEVEFLSIIVS
jgi:hypothetical protein